MGAPGSPCHRGSMRWHRTPFGYTVLEVLWVAVLLALAAGIAYPSFRSLVDATQARSAREAVVAFAQRARAEARAHGGATLEIREEEGRLLIRRGREDPARLELGSRFGVDLDAGGGDGPVLLHFDERGLGRVASRTIRVSRGEAERAAVLSTFGRVDRR